MVLSVVISECKPGSREDSVSIPSEVVAEATTNTFKNQRNSNESGKLWVRRVLNNPYPKQFTDALIHIFVVCCRFCLHAFNTSQYAKRINTTNIQ